MSGCVFSETPSDVASIVATDGVNNIILARAIALSVAHTGGLIRDYSRAAVRGSRAGEDIVSPRSAVRLRRAIA